LSATDGKVQISVLGAGSWGATLTWLLASSGRQLKLWARSQATSDRVASTHKIDKPLSVSIPEAVEVSSDLESSVSGSDMLLFCCPSQSMREVAERVSAVLSRTRSRTGARPVLVSAAKGLELTTLYRMSQVLSEVMPEQAVCALSGPNLAAEILAGLPTASVVGCQSPEISAFVRHALSVPNLRVYSNPDLAGVELGGTLKNIIAIAAGVSDGLSLGANAKAALLTRGLAEMTRLAVALGANALTLSGLAGMGDLFATCTSPLSRNYRLGCEMARGLSRDEVLSLLGATAEGVPTCQAVCELSKKLGIELPIAEQVEATLTGKTTPERAIMTLMSRPLVSE